MLWGYGNGGLAHEQLAVELAGPVVKVKSSGAELFFSGPQGSLNDATWHDLAVVYDGSLVIVYVDGVALGPASFGFALATTLDAGGLTLGRDNALAQGYFSGYLDEAAVCPTALTAAQIRAHYRAGQAP